MRARPGKPRMTVETAPIQGTPLGGWMWGILAGALAVALVLKGVDAHGRNAVLHLKLVGAQAELDRLRTDKKRMRDELKALKDDPAYIDAILKRRAAGGPEAPVVEH